MNVLKTAVISLLFTQLLPWLAYAQEPDLTIWKDPAFQQRFQEGLLAETDIEPVVTEKDREGLVVILRLMGEEKVDEAMAKLQKMVGEDHSAVFDFTLGHLLFQKERFDQADLAFSSATRKFPKYRRAWNYLGQTRVRNGKFEKAIPALTKVIELGGGSGVTYGVLGFAYSNIGNYISAESAYRMAVLLDATTMDWQMGLAKSFYHQRRYAELAAFCDYLISMDPERSDLWMLQANAFLGLNEPLRAAKNFEMLTALGKPTVAILNTLGDIYINEGLFDLAIISYLKALEIDPGSPLSRPLAAARNLIMNGGIDETKRLLNGIESRLKGSLDTPVQKEILLLRSRIAVAEGGGAEEAKVLEQVVALDPLDGEALILLGHYHRRNDSPAKAASYFERAAQIEGFEAKSLIGHAQLLVGQGNYQDAVPLLRKAQRIDPQDHVQDYLEQVERGAKSQS